MASRSAARRHGLPVLGVMREFAVVGVPPDVMGIGPAYAIPEVLRKAGECGQINFSLPILYTYIYDKNTKKTSDTMTNMDKSWRTWIDQQYPFWGATCIQLFID